MNFLKQLEGPNLPEQKFANFEDVRPTGFQPTQVKQPTKQWFAAPAPDGSDSFVPFFMNQPPRPTPAMRRFGNNDENPAD